MRQYLVGNRYLAAAHNDERSVNAGTHAVIATLPQQPNGSVAAPPIAAASASVPAAPAVGQDTVMAEAPASTAAMAPAALASAPAAPQEEPMPQAPPPRALSISPEERAEIPVRQTTSEAEYLLPMWKPFVGPSWGIESQINLLRRCMQNLG